MMTKNRYPCSNFPLLCSLLWFAAFASADEASTAPDVGVRFQPPTRVLLKNATLVVSAEREIEAASLLLDDGKIVAMGTQVDAPPGTEIIDCTGKFLYPAFIDAFAEFEARPTESAAGYWNSNAVPQRRMDLQLQADEAKLEGLRKAGIGLVLAAPNNGILKGQSCLISTANSSLAKTLIRDQVFHHVRLFPSRGSTESYPNSPMGAMALVRQTLLDAQWYQRAMQSVAVDPSLPQPEHNVSLEALQSALRAEQAVVIDGSNELYALRADRIAREFSLKAIIRGSGREYRSLDALSASHRTFILPVDFPDAPKLATENEVQDATLQSLMHWRLAPENPGRMEKAGMSFVLTASGLEKPTELLAKVRMAIAAGLSEQRALEALTSAPAKLLGVDQISGTLDAGKLANVLLTSGRIFDKATQIESTWVQGQRSSWKVEPTVDVRGSWELTVVGSEQKLQLEISGSAVKLAAKIGLPDEFNKEDKSKLAETKPDSKKEDEKVEKKVDKKAADQADSDPPVSDDQGTPDADKTDADKTDADKTDDDKTDAGTKDDADAAQEKDKTSPKPTEVKDITFNEFVFSGTFEAEKLRPENSGRAWISGVLLTQSATSGLDGTLLWPDGTAQRFTAVSLADSSEAKKQEKKEKPEDEPKEPVACQVNFPLGAYGRTEQPAQPAVVLFKNATLWTSSADGILESTDLLVRNGLIDSLGKNIAAPADALVIDASTLHISPGIIDCHSHMATDGGVNESGQAITAEVRIGDFIDPNDITIYRQLAGGLTTSNILHGSANPIGGQNQVIKLRWGSLAEDLKMKEAPAGIKFALGENVKQSSRESAGTRYPQSRMGVEQILRDRFEAAKLYRSHWQAWTSSPSGLPPRRDLELEAMVEILEGKRWVHCHSYRQDEILMVLQLLDDYDITIGTLQHILEGYKVADAMAKHGAMGSSFSDWWAYKLEVLDAIPYNGALMHRAGVVVSFNSDDAELARHLNHEAAKAVKYGGIEPSEALKFVTLNPARQLRIDQWVGSLEPGKQADLAIWNQSPLSTLSVCTQTWIDGRKYFDREEDLVRRQADEQLRLALIQSAVAQGAGKGSNEADKDPSLWWVRYDEFCHHGHHDHDE